MTDKGKATMYLAPLTGGPLKEVVFQFGEAERSELQKILAKSLVNAKPQPTEASVTAFIQAVEGETGKFIELKFLDKERPRLPEFEVSLRELNHATLRLVQAWRAIISRNPPLRILLEHSLEPDPQLAKIVKSQRRGMSNQEFRTGVKGPDDDKTWDQMQDSEVRRATAAQFLGRLNKDIATLRNIIFRSYKAHHTDKKVAPEDGDAPRRKGGRPKDHWRRMLASDIARAFREHLGITPTAGRHGAFESVLRVAFRSAKAGIKDLDLHRLALEIVKQSGVQKPPEI